MHPVAKGVLGNRDGIGDWIDKPKGMRWRTFDRHMARIEAAEEIVNGYTALLLGRLMKRYRRTR